LLKDSESQEKGIGMTEGHQIYGPGVDQIHPFFERKREWSKVYVFSENGTFWLPG